MEQGQQIKDSLLQILILKSYAVIFLKITRKCLFVLHFFLVLKNNKYNVVN